MLTTKLNTLLAGLTNLDHHIMNILQTKTGCIYTSTPKYLTEYNQHTNNITPANYLKLPIQLNHRRAISRLRLQSNKLAIVTGRYTRPKTPPEQRFCKHCLNCNSVDDEHHFINECTSSSKLRTSIFYALSNINPTFNQLSAANRTHYFLHPVNKDEAELIGYFIIKSFQLRDKMIQTPH